MRHKLRLKAINADMQAKIQTQSMTMMQQKCRNFSSFSHTYTEQRRGKRKHAAIFCMSTFSFLTQCETCMGKNCRKMSHISVSNESLPSTRDNNKWFQIKYKKKKEKKKKRNKLNNMIKFKNEDKKCFELRNVWMNWEMEIFPQRLSLQMCDKARHF